MKQKQVKWIFVFLFAIGLTGLRGQTFLQVKEKSGAQISYVLNTIRKLAFTAGNMTLSGTDGSSHDFTLVDVQNINFSYVTSLAEVNPDGAGSLTIYPNPVKDLLRVQYGSATVESLQVQLLDIQGKVIYQQQVKTQAGTNSIEIPVASFRNGLYLCRVIGENKSEIKKFIKF